MKKPRTRSASPYFQKWREQIISTKQMYVSSDPTSAESTAFEARVMAAIGSQTAIDAVSEVSPRDAIVGMMRGRTPATPLRNPNPPPSPTHPLNLNFNSGGGEGGVYEGRDTAGPADGPMARSAVVAGTHNRAQWQGASEAAVRCGTGARGARAVDTGSTLPGADASGPDDDDYDDDHDEGVRHRTSVSSVVSTTTDAEERNSPWLGMGDAAPRRSAHLVALAASARATHAREVAAAAATAVRESPEA